MPLRYLLDESLRGPLWQAIRRHNLTSGFPIDVIRVGDPPELPLGSSDPELLLWAEHEQRILVSADKGTLISHLTAHLAAKHHCPGIFILLSRASLRDAVSYLTLASYASEQSEWIDRVQYLG
jgi:hypothetical protein